MSSIILDPNGTLATPQNEKVNVNELSDVEHFALNYTLALVGGPGSKAYARYDTAVKQIAKSVSETQMRQDLQRGLKGLLDKGLIEAKRNGEGDWVPFQVNLNRLDMTGTMALA